MENNDTFIVSARRSAIGKFGGALRDYPLHTWSSAVLRSAVQHSGIAPEKIERVIVGRCFGTDNRRITIEAGIPHDAISSSVYLACASGLAAVHEADRLIRLGEADVVAAGGVEQMSAVPFLSHQTRWGARFGHVEMEDWLKSGLTCYTTGIPMGITAENIRRKHGISRREQDAFAHRSQEKAAAAIQAGGFREEIEPILIPGPRGTTHCFDTDEYPRLTSEETLAGLKPAFEADGTVTAGNASGLNDGAAFLVLASGKQVRESGVKPLARVVANAASGIDPKLMGLGPVLSMQRALEKARLKPEEIDLYEINEAFAVQVLGVLREFPIAEAKLNVNGGAIALGHPVGCSGARILTTLIHELRRRGGRYGMASLCIGGGMGAATIIETL